MKKLIEKIVRFFELEEKACNLALPHCYMDMYLCY